MANLYLAFLIYITFAILFVQFFLNAYYFKKKPSTKKAIKHNREEKSEKVD